MAPVTCQLVCTMRWPPFDSSAGGRHCGHPHSLALSEEENDLTYVGGADNGKAAIEDGSGTPSDVVLMDLSMHVMKGSRQLARLGS